MEKYYRGFGTLSLKDNNVVTLEIDLEKDYDTTVEDVDVFYDALTELIEGLDGKYIMYTDASKGKWMKGEARVRLGKRQKIFDSTYCDKQFKTILVVSNAIVKMMLKGINLMAKPAVEPVIFSKVEDAREELQREIQKRA